MCFSIYLEEARAMCDRAHHLKWDYEEAINIAATKQGFVHNDLGLDNIVIAHDGTAYLIDFEGCHQKSRWHDLYALLIGLDILNFPDALYAQDILSV
jgi:thiamine kinase-like enzyme